MNRRKLIKKSNECIDIANELLSNKDKYYISAIHTTGIDDSDQIIQIAVTDLNENITYNSLAKPNRKKINPEASYYNNLTDFDLKNAPLFEFVYNEFYKTIGDKALLVYNAEFYKRLFKQTCQKNKLPVIDIKLICIQQMNTIFNMSEKYIKLNRNKNDISAAGNCLSIKNTIHNISISPKTPLPKWWQIF